MRRREFIARLTGAAAAWPAMARGQTPERLRQIAILVGPARTDVEADRRLRAFREGLRALGWTEGENIAIETRWGAGNPELIEQYASELVRWKPDLIFTNSTPVTRAFKRITTTIPIVFAAVSDPVGDGFVASLARPGGNITGFSNFDSEIGGKWVELLHEVAPEVRHAALVFNPKTAPGGGTAFIRPSFDTAARKLALQPIPVAVQSVAELEGALGSHARAGKVGLIIMPDSFNVANSATIIRLCRELRLPAIYPFRTFANSGGLASYGVDTADVNRRAASYVDRILKGTQPADLPIQNPTRLELAINLKTAQALGLTIPPTLLARADDVIE
jgi:putative ABC transport system substrate-binding protein